MKTLFEKQLTPHHSYKVYNDRPDFPFVEVNQVHGNDVLNILDVEPNAQADGIYFLYSDENKLPLAIKTADCLPVCLMGEKGAALIHAGWKGLQKEILKHPGLKSLNIQYAFIGPSISGDSYEVGEEFLDHFKPFPHSFKSVGSSLRFSLQKTATSQLKLFYPDLKIEDCRVDTFTTPSHNSYRRDKTSKRNFNILFV